MDFKLTETNQEKALDIIVDGSVKRFDQWILVIRKATKMLESIRV